MPRWPFPFILSFAAVAAFASSHVFADAAKNSASPIEMHRTAAGTDDGTGWYSAVSTLGKFSVLLPAPFNDYTIRIEDPNIGLYVTNTVGFKSSDGFEVMVSKMNGTEKSKEVDLDGLLVGLKSKPMGKDIAASQKTTINGLPALDVMVKSSERAAHMIYLVDGKTLYTVAVDCPLAMAAMCIEIKDKMLATFKRS
jgi:hypothetical protein